MTEIFTKTGMAMDNFFNWIGSLAWYWQLIMILAIASVIIWIFTPKRVVTA